MECENPLLPPFRTIIELNKYASVLFYKAHGRKKMSVTLNG